MIPEQTTPSAFGSGVALLCFLSLWADSGSSLQFVPTTAMPVEPPTTPREVLGIDAQAVALTVLQGHETAQTLLFWMPEQRHVVTSLAATQHWKQCNQQHLMQVMACGIAAARVANTLK
jgi:hypothetical protein